MSEGNGGEALLPHEIAQKAISVGIKKATLPVKDTFYLAILAGAFIAAGAFFATTSAAGATNMLPYGVIRFLMGLSFCLGLILVVVAGAELFTGNNLIVIAWASRKVSTMVLLRNWIIVYVGNFVGSLLTAFLMVLGKQYTFGGGAVGMVMFSTASSKIHLGFIQALSLGILCNALVCIAIWLTWSGRSVSDKILAIIFPITAFVAAGFEHSVANMYFIPVALMVKDFDPAFATSVAQTLKIALEDITWVSFLLNNLLPVTIGNIIGGAGMVGLIYWQVYLRNEKNPG